MQHTYAIQPQSRVHSVNIFIYDFKQGIDFFKHKAVIEKPAHLIESVVKSFWIVLHQDINN